MFILYICTFLTTPAPTRFAISSRNMSYLDNSPMADSMRSDTGNTPSRWWRWRAWKSRLRRWKSKHKLILAHQFCSLFPSTWFHDGWECHGRRTRFRWDRARWDSRGDGTFLDPGILFCCYLKEQIKYLITHYFNRVSMTKMKSHPSGPSARPTSRRKHLLEFSRVDCRSDLSLRVQSVSWSCLW